jgi:hypothetical protein
LSWQRWLIDWRGFGGTSTLEDEREVKQMRVEKSDDRAYPYTIKGGWGDKVYCTVADLKEIKKQINAILKEEKMKKGIDK